MLRHYLKTAVRSLLKRKFYSATNIFGLAIGLAMCLTVIGHISNELGFEDCHAHRADIYRLEATYSFEDTTFRSARAMEPLGAALVEGLSDVEQAAVFRVHQVRSVTIDQERSRVVNEYEGQGYAHGNKLIFADPGFFDVFTLPMISGSPRALAEPNVAFISEFAAATYFENENPVGQEIVINDNITCQIRGILADIPQNTQIHSSFVVSYATLDRIGEPVGSWTDLDHDYVYLRLEDGATAATVESRIAGVFEQYLPEETSSRYQFNLMALKDIYFNVYGSGKRGELYPAGEASFIYEMGVMALFILIIAVANFINLSTARAAERMKEVGVRKVFGAKRSHLVRQFLGESIVIATVSTLLAVLLYELLKIQIQASLPRQMLLDFYESPLMVAGLAGLVLTVGVIAGLYPAVYLSRFRPIAVLQAKAKPGSSKSWLRRILVVFQFAIATLFVFCTTVIIRQTTMMTTMEMGFDRENVLLLDFEGERAAEECALMKNEIDLNHRGLLATATNCPPGRESHYYYGFHTDERRRDEDRTRARLFAGDRDFVSTFGLRVADGKPLAEAAPTESGLAVLVTEATVENLELDNPVGSRLYRSEGRFYEIVGVVEDFAAAPVGVGSSPNTMIAIVPDLCRTLAVKLPAENVAGSIAAIKETWEKTLPGYEFAYTFLDDEIDAALSEYRSQSGVFLSLAVFAIAIACLGIFGLVSFTSSQRKSEIGIRKVLGASVPSVVKLLSREFVILTLIANVIALPLATLMMMDILRWFPKQVSMGPGTYLFVVALVVLVALATTGLQSLKAANSDPVESLRCE